MYKYLTHADVAWLTVEHVLDSQPLEQHSEAALQVPVVHCYHRYGKERVRREGMGEEGAACCLSASYLLAAYADPIGCAVA